MATLDNSNIVNGNIIQPNDILQLYSAFTAGGGYDVSISGSLTGSATSASFAISSSNTISSSYSLTSSFSQNAFPFSGSARITGSLTVSSSLVVTGSLTITGSLAGNITGSNGLKFNLGGIGTEGNFVIPTSQPSTPSTGSMYVDAAANRLYIYNGTTWKIVPLT